MVGIVLREIQQKDNASAEAMIRSVFDEIGIPKVGTAYQDEALKTMYEAYDRERAVYYVLEKEGKIVGGGGVAKLDGQEGNICELQKMYFLPEARGSGWGSKMMELCLEKAVGFGFDACYLETMPYMKAAQKLYKQVGFEYIDAPMGDTGHCSCPVWMLKKL